MRTMLYPVLIVLSIFLVGCDGPSAFASAQSETTAVVAPTTLTIFAAASLTDAFTQIAIEFEAAQPGVEILFNFAGSQALRLQIEQGARADIFAPADQLHAEALLATNLIEAPVIFAQNRLVVIMPATNPASIKTLADLTRPDLKLVLAGPNVPAGQYARQVLEKLNHHPALSADFSNQVLNNLVSEEDNVRGVVAKVHLGEADAGIAYASDMTAVRNGGLATLVIPSEFNVVADYPLARVSSSAQPEIAQAFIDYVLSPRGQAILTQYGFQSAQPPS